jgi:outer membrane protein assembly factor BamB
MVVAENKVYAASSAQYGDPVFRGAKLYAINAQTGTRIWSMQGFFTSGLAIADGYLVGFNTYDNQIYSFGKGQSATSVAATPGIGNAITIQGSVTDQSPGKTCLGIPAAGTPAIADENMADWMAYLYEQQPMPSNAKGVGLTIYVTDPSGTTTPMPATTDISGNYAISLAPTSSGIYKITASFEGTGSYFASTGETSIAVQQTAATPAPTASPTVANTGNVLSPEIFYAVSAVLAILLVVVAVLVLRKK